MSSSADSPTALNRRTWTGLVVAGVVLFVLAHLPANNSSHRGVASNVVFAAFAIAVVLLIALAIATVVKSRRGASR